MTRWLILGPMVLGTVGLYFFFSLGFYKSVEIEEISNAQFLLLAKSHEGAYHKILPVIQDVEQWAKDHGVSCERTFGEYLDDPSAVDEDRLKSFGGCVVEQPPQQIAPPLQLRHFAYPRAVHARFLGAPSIGPFKVYPKVKAWLAERKLSTNSAALEIYIPNGSEYMTEFYFPILNESEVQHE